METADDWDARYRAGDTPWDKGEAAPPLADFVAKSRPPITGDVLVPGCGLGHDVRLIATRSDARPLGLDLSPEAIRRARAFPHAGAEAYRHGDFLDLGPDLHGSFDWIFEHTCVCALHPCRRPEYARSAASALRPGGHLLAIFFLHIEDPEGPPYPISHDEIDLLFSPFFTTRQRIIPSAAYPGREGREELHLLAKRD